MSQIKIANATLSALEQFLTGRMPFAPLENGKYDAETYNVPHNVTAFAITATAKEDGVSTGTHTFTVIRQEAEDSA